MKNLHRSTSGFGVKHISKAIRLRDWHRPTAGLLSPVRRLKRNSQAVCERTAAQKLKCSWRQLEKSMWRSGKKASRRSHKNQRTAKGEIKSTDWKREKVSQYRCGSNPLHHRTEKRRYGGSCWGKLWRSMRGFRLDGYYFRCNELQSHSRTKKRRYGGSCR